MVIFLWLLFVATRLKINKFDNCKKLLFFLCKKKMCCEKTMQRLRQWSFGRRQGRKYGTQHEEKCRVAWQRCSVLCVRKNRVREERVVPVEIFPGQ